MFRFNKTVKAFKTDCDSFHTPYDGKKIIATDFSVNAGKRLRPLRIAACTAVAAAVVLTGALWIPKAQQTDDAHSFEIVAYAADTGNKSVPLKQDMNVTLPAGNISYENNLAFAGGKLEGGEITWMNGFICSGKNLSNVTYSCKRATLDYTCTENEKKKSDIEKKSIVCVIKVPISKLQSASEISSFKSLWESGALNEYRNKYFKGKDIDMKRYYISIGMIENLKNQENNWIFYSEVNSNSPLYGGGCFLNKLDYEKKENTNKAVIIIQDTKYPNFGFSSTISGKSVTAKASDHKGMVMWHFNSIDLSKVRVSVKGSTFIRDYSAIPGDTFTVKAKFIDSTIITKYIHVSFSKSGKLCAKLTDK